MARLSTHVLDLSLGGPAAGVRIELFRADGAAKELLRAVETNRDGRTDAPLLDAATPGVYELHFHAGAYYRTRGVALPDPPFLDEVVIRFGVADGASYHVPLLLSPYGYSTYRGS